MYEDIEKNIARNDDDVNDLFIVSSLWPHCEQSPFFFADKLNSVNSGI